MENKMEIKNKKAYFNYYVLDKYEAGIVLKGSEIKSLKKGSASINEAYIRIKNREAFVINMVIAKYDAANIFNHSENRERKLLLHKKEIKKIMSLDKNAGYTLIPLRIYLKHNRAKLEIGICKGKKLYDKREAIKERDLKRLGN